jgi:hypothetical protein
VTFVFAAAVFLRIRSRYRQFPLITYTALVYTLGAVSSVLVRTGLKPTSGVGPPSDGRMSSSVNALEPVAEGRLECQRTSDAG